MSVRMRHTKAHSANRRSHHALSEPRLSKCACGAYHERHRACAECGTYRGKQVVDVVAQTERATRRAKQKEQLLQQMGMAGAGEASQEAVKKEALEKEKSEK